MDTATLKNNFEEQLEQATKQIAELEQNLAKANEYRVKLLGGLETLSLLEEQPEAPYR
jgi:hypothetical protein